MLKFISENLQDINNEKKNHPLLGSSFLWLFNISTLPFPSPAERCHLFFHLRVWDTRSSVGKGFLRKKSTSSTKIKQKWNTSYAIYTVFSYSVWPEMITWGQLNSHKINQPQRADFPGLTFLRVPSRVSNQFYSHRKVLPVLLFFLLHSQARIFSWLCAK